MNISGFELVQPVESSFCSNVFCSSIVPLCFAGVSPSCSRNRSTLGWHHFSFGEHVCHVCFEFLGFKPRCGDSAWRHRMSSWRRERNRKSSARGRQAGTTEADFLAAQFLPWWLQCRQCGHWRQLPPRIPVGDPASSYHPSTFTCSSVIKLCDTPCSWPVDERATLVLERPYDFLSSMRVHAWLQAVPAFDALCTFGVDLTGLSVDSLPGSIHEHSTSESKAAHWFPFGENSPFPATDLLSWERTSFPEMARFPTLYLAVRNLVLCLWHSAPKRLLTNQITSDHCFVRGLLRIVLCEHWIPRVLEEFTCRGLINFGACELHPSIELTPPLMADEGPDREVVQLSVRVLGQFNLCNAVTTRHIMNGILTRQSNLSKPDGSKQPHPSSLVDVCLQPILAPSIAHNQSDPLEELCIRISSSSTSAVLNPSDFRNQPDSTNQSSSSTQNGIDTNQSIQVSFTASSFQYPAFEDTVSSAERRIFIPAHFWSDRLHLHRCHPVSTLAQQMNMTLSPLDPFHLFELHTEPESGVKSLTPVSVDYMIRMEFHVEAVLDMIAQLCDATCASTDDKKSLTTSVQDSWDMFDVKVRERVTDLDNSESEKRLTDYYLASVEYDLTEPLTINPTPAPVTYPTACLDKLPTRYYSEFLTDRAIATDVAIPNNLPFSPHTLTDLSGLRRTGITNMCASFLFSSHFTRTKPPPPVLSLSVHHDDVPLRSSFQPNCTPQTRNDLAQLTVNTQRVCTTPLVSLHTSNEENVERVDWVVLCSPLQNLRFIFSDEVPHPPAPLTDAPKTDASSAPKTLSVYLPAYLKRVLLTVTEENNPNTGAPHMDEDLTDAVDVVPNATARLITVTLIYPSAWWRPVLAVAKSQQTVAFDADHVGLSDNPMTHGDAPQHFAFFPTSRENRAFCHVFRDVCPSLDSPGVLQTQVFAAAADLWWSESDAHLTTAIDHYLHSILNPKVDESRTPIEHPLNSHVARMDYHSSREASRNLLTILDVNNRPLSLKPNAADELAKECHIIIPNLLVQRSKPASCDLESSPEFGDMTTLHGMDAITSAVYSGLRFAEVTLRSIFKLNASLAPSHTDTDLESSDADSSHCVGEFTVTDGRDSDNEFIIDQPVASAPYHCS